MGDVIFVFKNAEGKKFEVKMRPSLTCIGELTKKKEQAAGLCFGPDEKHPRIVIDSTLQPRRELAVAIEEFCHAFFFDQPEKKVRPFAARLRDFLYKRGWRKVK